MAKTTKHATAHQAATIAKMAQVDQLILGHYSSRYKEIEPFLKEASAVFDKVELAESGKVFEINRQ